MAFKALVMRKPGREDRVVGSPVDLVQLEHEGFVVVREASKAVATAAGSGTTVSTPAGS